MYNDKGSKGFFIGMRLKDFIVLWGTLADLVTSKGTKSTWQRAMEREFKKHGLIFETAR